jgi:asparagine synthase (glutamine-hydrolysing)
MCGIAGTIGFDARVIDGMTERLRHRGPDGGATFIDGDFAMGHRRLAILDLSDAGRQPMMSRDGRFAIALNGEIFNYLELRSELGLECRTGSDTEVLVEACAQWGLERALARSVGMFALALWDRRERELTLARDRAGEKPLVYFERGGQFAFASEMKALTGLIDRRLDAAAVDAYLALGQVPAPLGIYRDTKKLPAGHWLKFRNGSSTVRRWYSPRVATAGTLRDVIRDAVRLRLRADVPVALCLSGGVDSSGIAAECVALGADVQTFTACFDGDETDLPYARQVAQTLGLRHLVLRVDAPEPESVFRHYDEPFADTSAVPSLALARAMEGCSKVVLNGDGGDEAFGGYRHYEHIAIKQWVKRAAAGAGVVDGSSATGIYVQSKAAFRVAERRELMNGNWTGNALDRLTAGAGRLRALRMAMASDRELGLSSGLTYKMDVALGAAGMEGRAPFLDHRVVERAEGLDDRELVSGREKKIALRAAYRGVLPDAVLDRPKHGFGAPVGKWLDGAWREFVGDALPCVWFDRAAQSGLRGQRLWTLAAFAAWAREWGATW